MFKKKLSFCMTLMMVMSLLAGNLVQGETFQEASEEAATICTALGMLQGTGSGVTPAYLASKPQRYQGAILLLRLMGRYDAALIHPGTTGYTDTNSFTWVAGRKILHYLHANQSTIGFKGYPDNSFNPYGIMDAKQYYKVMLVALGYVENVDFAWNATGTLPGTLEMAQSLGLTWLQSDTDFTIGDLAVATVEALRTPYKGMTKTLGQKLIDEGVINGSVAESVGLFPSSTPGVVIPQAETQIVLPYEMAVNTAYTEIIINVENVTFKSTVGQDSTETATLIAGITGNLDTAHSWNNSMKPILRYGWITRISDTMIKVNTMNTSDYAINSDEILTVTLDPSLFNETLGSPLSAGTVTIVDSGAGTMSDPYAILRPEDFMFVLREKDKYFELANDLDFTGKYLVRVSDFSGRLNGNNHVISNLSLKAVDSLGTGLFSSITSGTVENIKFKDCTVIGNLNTNIALVAGKTNNLQMSGISIDNCAITNGRISGFLVGKAEGKSTILDSVIKNSTIDVSGTTTNVNFIGGAVGASDVAAGDYTNMTNVVLQDVDITGTNSSSLGGLVGYSVNRITLDGCQFRGNIVGKRTVAGMIASPDGKTATNLTTIQNSKVYGTLEADEVIGGIVANANGYYTLKDNYSGLTSVTYKVAAFNTAHTHRVLGWNNGSSVTMSNTALAGMKAYDFGGADHSSLFVSNIAGLDGENALLFLLPIWNYEFSLWEPIVPGLFNPGPYSTIDDLVKEWDDIIFELPHSDVPPLDPIGPGF